MPALHRVEGELPSVKLHFVLSVGCNERRARDFGIAPVAEGTATVGNCRSVRRSRLKSKVIIKSPECSSRPGDGLITQTVFNEDGEFPLQMEANGYDRIQVIPLPERSSALGLKCLTGQAACAGFTQEDCVWPSALFRTIL